METKHREMSDRLAEGNITGIWWAPAVNRKGDQTGTSHIVHSGGTLCGANPFSTGGSFRSAAECGTLECRRCRMMLDRATNTVTRRTASEHPAIRFPKE